MFSIAYYISRWIETNRYYFISNIVFTAIISSITCWVASADFYTNYSSTKACLFALLMATIWSGLFNTITRFTSEAHFMIDELQKIVSIKVYMISNLIIQMILCAMEALLISYVYTELRSYYNVVLDGLWLTNHVNCEIFIGFFLIILSADMLGFFAGIAVKKINTLMSIVPFLLILQFLFSGCLFNLRGSAKALSSFATAKYGFAILGTGANLNQMAKYEALKNDLFDYTASNLVSCWRALIVLSFAFFILAWIALAYKVNKFEG